MKTWILEYLDIFSVKKNRKIVNRRAFVSAILLCSVSASAQSTGKAIEFLPAAVYFDRPLQEWDGFGFNYVETAQTRDYEANPQDYGGFSLLSESEKSEITELVFGAEGLDIDILKLFLDPWHQVHPDSGFDHRSTTKNMLTFAKRGMLLAGGRGKEIEVITTLYGPPPWATLQEQIGGRDLDETATGDLIDYVLDWVRFLREQQLAVRYISIHNEGEDFYRWDFESGLQRMERFDYNLYWPPEQVNRFVKRLADAIEGRGFKNLYVTNGEPSNWTRFLNWGYASALQNDPETLSSLGLLTTHGFLNGDFNRLSYGAASGKPLELIREIRPDLHAWITSYSWGEMDTRFIRMAHEHIYSVGVNALIPWAGIQHASNWIDGDPNPGTAIVVGDDGGYEVTTGYYLYKQLTSAGHRGMRVVETMAANPVSALIAFSGKDTVHPDTFVLTSRIGIWKLPFKIQLSGTKYTSFQAFRTSENGLEHYEEIGVFPAIDGTIVYDAPFGTVTTFIGVE